MVHGIPATLSLNVQGDMLYLPEVVPQTAMSRLMCCGRVPAHLKPQQVMPCSTVLPQGSAAAPLHALPPACHQISTNTTHHAVHAQIPSQRVVGAALVGPSSLTVWYMEPVKGSEVGASSPSFRLCKSAPFACSSGQEATAMVEEIRRTSCWWVER